jgi:transcriptional regulator with XRE-family HTH domain
VDDPVLWRHSQEYVPKTAQLGRLVAERRRMLSLAQWELGDRIGVNQPTISNLERGIYGVPSLLLLAHLADALEVPLGALIEALGFRLS